ncbi:MAG: DUF5320 domain-containing protein [Deltaproteobacteria bacterium]|nr:DUF5320 domain-containing protein [Deltaproteobacteria bacterium]
MPAGDGTGPAGMGPRSGGGFGACPPGTGTTAGAPLRGIGRGGLPWGGGRGRLGGGGGTGFLGFCRGFFGAQRMTPQDEGIILGNRVSALEGELAATREQLSSLRKDARGKAE